MRFYLRVINPVISIVILILCTWAAIHSDMDGSNNDIKLSGIILGYLTSYFFAKGLFCSSALFISGRTLLGILNINSTKTEPKLKKNEWLLIFGFLTLLLGMLFFLYYDEYLKKEDKVIKPEITYNHFDNPKEIQIIENNWIKESEYLRITGKIKNSSAIIWDTLELSAPIFIGGRYSTELNETEKDIQANEERYFVLSSSTILTKEIKDSLNYKIKLKAVNQIKK